ncbi:hypothetical protein GCM10010420_01430 [Streptomyces glaucosporus]|uniref:Integral membrane protein n=1 Tax=Streptomyces glaucosporus TaxID=284044 RepID=A0ABN3HL64_9ACTN
MAENTPGVRAPRLWVAPLVSTLVTLLLAYVAFFFVALSPMACDSCDDAQNARFQPSFETGFAVFRYGLLIPPALLLLGWGLAGKKHDTPWRKTASLLAPCSVVLLYLAFLSLVDWP